MQQPQGLKPSLSEAEEKTKEGLCAALENAVLKLRSAASKSLDAAIAKLEMADVTGYEMISPLVRRTTELFAAVGMTKDVYATVEGITVSGDLLLLALLYLPSSLLPSASHLPLPHYFSAFVESTRIGGEEKVIGKGPQ